MSIDKIDLLHAITRGTAFIKSQLIAGKSGLACSGSDHTPRFSNDKGHLFSGYFISEAIGNELNEVERSILLVRLMSEEMNGYWGYSSRGYYKCADDNPYFVDADDTAFALRTYRQLGVYKSPLRLLHFYRKSRALTRRGIKFEKGFVTFATKKKPRLACTAKAENNLDMHPEVNANVFNTLIDSNYESFINFDIVSCSQSHEGYWYSYFYPSKFYSTFLYLEFLKRLSFCQEQREKGVSFLQGSQNEDGSWGNAGNAFETALALKGLELHVMLNDPILKGAHFIVSCQSEDGSWGSDNIIWEFHDENHDIWQARDTNRIVTTALCVSALKQCHLLGEEGV